MLTRNFSGAMFLAAMISSGAVWSQDQYYEKSEAVIGKQLPNYRLLDQDGRFVALHKLRSKYLLVNFIYTNCPGPCIAITQSVANLMENMDPEVVIHVHALSITIDHANDSSEKLKEYALEFTDGFERWTFARSDQDTLRNMADGLGFYFTKTSEGWFEHMNRLTVVGPDMKPIIHYYGTDFDPVEVEEAIKASMDGRDVQKQLTDSISKALVLCSDYDPVTGTYQVDFKFLIQAGVNYLLVAATIAFFMWGPLTRTFHRIFGGLFKSGS